MKRTITDVTDAKLNFVIAAMKVDNPTSITKNKQDNGLWTVIGEFPDNTVAPADLAKENEVSSPDLPFATTAKTAASSVSASSAPEDLVLHPKIKAMLEVLAFTEGTGNNYGKVVNGTVIKSPHDPQLVGKKNVSVTDLSRHPEILVQVNAAIKSTAAGRYQFLKKTWDELNMPNFQPKSQDIAAVKLMKRRKMIEPLLSDDLHEAVFRGAPEWASLPTKGGGSFFGGQPARTIKEIEKKYKEALA